MFPVFPHLFAMKWRLLRVLWTARRSSQSILKEISPGISLEGIMLKLKLQSFGHLVQRVDSLEKTLMLGRIRGRRRRGWQRMRWLDGITDSMDLSWVTSGSWWWTGRPGVLRFMGSQRVGHHWATELKWTELNWWSLGPWPGIKPEPPALGARVSDTETPGKFLNLNFKGSFRLLHNIPIHKIKVRFMFPKH